MKFTHFRSHFHAGEARKQFKECVNILSTIRIENNEKYLILRKRYINESPIDDTEDELNLLVNPEMLQSPGSRSTISEYDLAAFGEPSSQYASPEKQQCSPYREPPPYKPPPKVMHHAYMNQQKYGECVDEYKTALMAIGRQRGGVIDDGTVAAAVEELPPEMPSISKPSKDDSNLNVQSKRVIEHSASGSSIRDEVDDKENVPSSHPPIGVAMLSAENTRTLDKHISVKEATKKFNRIASEEEAAKITSPPAKKKPEKVSSNGFLSFIVFPILIATFALMARPRSITFRSKSSKAICICYFCTAAAFDWPRDERKTNAFFPFWSAHNALLLIYSPIKLNAAKAKINKLADLPAFIFDLFFYKCFRIVRDN